LSYFRMHPSRCRILSQSTSSSRDGRVMRMTG
jgi:hypothetical protein